jgi:GT2 family glycosyltransferase
VHPPALPRALRERAEPWRAERSRTVGWAIAACLAAPTRTLRELGPFDPAHFLFHEDLDLCLRARAAGVPTVLHPQLRVRHLGGHATGRAYGGEPHLLIAATRRAAIERTLGRRARRLDDLARVTTFATRAAARRALRRPAARERAQLAAQLAVIRRTP